jgi:histidinol dehydrogenase
MSIVPAKIAGVKRIVAVSPPNNKGKIDPLTIVAANISGADEIYKIGGAQAIAALSYGTKSISPVDKIVGPGGVFVTAAKSLVSDSTGIDMLAGPTELGIIADSSADPKYIALDLISQAEHSSDTFCYCINFFEILKPSIMTELKSQKNLFQ